MDKTYIVVLEYSTSTIHLYEANEYLNEKDVRDQFLLPNHRMEDISYMVTHEEIDVQWHV